ncbi:MAG TPA: BBP7 family outer membrane beta-barrel protein [Lacipirellulaceae bacterium]|nr:BBP7 family outer membrane beta-barrel protein [Lacipirellulaceae bacterium]
MNALRRTAAAVGLWWMTVGGAALAGVPFPADAAIDSIEWMEPCTLPSATDAAGVVHDAQFQLASCCDPVDDCCTLDWADGDACGDCFSAAAWAQQPMWSVAAGAIFLHRSRPDPAAIITPPTGTPGVTVNGAEFGFGWDAGPDVSLLRRTRSGLLLEGRYFNDREADAAQRIPNINTFRVAGIGVTILGGGSINSFYATKLDSAEFNVHTPLTDRVTVLGGFRWIELRDTLRSDIATPATFVQWDNRNHMYGGQIGTNISLTRPTNPLRLNCALKAGLYGNVADNRYRSTIMSSTSDRETETAFAGEINVTAAYYVTKHIALRGGYQVLWLDHVAIAADAAARTTQVAGGTQSFVQTDGRVWYNGALAGVEFTW